MRTLTLLALLVLAACTPPRYEYGPIRTTSADVAGTSGAVYVIPPEAPRGEVRIAALGVGSLRANAIENSTDAVRILLVVSNRSDETWIVDGGEQRMIVAGHEDVRATTERVERVARTEIPPKSTRSLELWFPLPADIEGAGELPVFIVEWTVHAGDRIVNQRTSFERSVVGQKKLVRPLEKPESNPTTSSPLPGDEPPNRR
jgi:hypothetical protein